jgi:hypothetical protein
MKTRSFKHWIANLEVEVSFTHYPEEPMVRYYPDGSGHPGCSASVNDICITTKINGVDVDITDVLEALEYDIEDIAWEVAGER